MSEFNRRAFLYSASAASLAGVALSSWSRAAAAADEGQKSANTKRKFTMCLSCGMLGVRAEPRETIALAAQFGFESVEPPVGLLMKLSDAELAEMLAELKAKHLAWGATGLSVNFRGDDAAFKADLAKLPAAAAGLQRAGITRVATWLSPSHRSLTYVANFRQHATRLREVAKVLGDHGLRLGLEYVGTKSLWTSSQFPFIHTMAEMKDLIAEIGQDSVGFLLDSWHWFNARETEADLLSLGNRDVVLCHLNDAPAGVPIDQQQDGTRELPCATGVIDVKTYLGALVKIGYDGPVAAEPFYKPLGTMPRDEALRATADAMRKAFALVE